MELLSTVDLALVAAVGGMMVIGGRTSVGVVVAFLQYVLNFFRPIQTVAQLWTMAQSALAAAERVFELLDMEPTVKDAPDAVEVEQVKGRITFDRVSFGYEQEVRVLCDVSFEASPAR